MSLLEEKAKRRTYELCRERGIPIGSPQMWAIYRDELALNLWAAGKLDENDIDEYLEG